MLNADGRKIVMFDWNNTVFDDFWVWRRAINKSFRKFGKKPPTVREFFEIYKGPITEAFRHFGIEATSEEIHKDFDELYEKHNKKLTLASDVYNALFVLSKLGFDLALVTACNRGSAIDHIERFELVNAFNCMEFGATNKAEAIKRLALNKRAKARDCFYVGDSPSDMMHARRAGVNAVAFLNGHIPIDLVLLENPAYQVKNFNELVQMLAAWNNLRRFETKT